MTPAACSFCGKDEEECAKLVRGPTVAICDGCVALTSNIVWQHYQVGIDAIREKQRQLELPMLSRPTVQEETK